MHTPAQYNLSVAVLGPGAVGGFLTALLVKNGIDVTCVAKEPLVKIISQDGIYLQSRTFGDFIVRPRVIAQLDMAPNILFITTKATTLTAALERVDPNLARGAIIIPLLNGIEHMGILRSYFGKSVVAASIGNLEVKRISPNHIIHSTPSAHIALSSEEGVSIQCLTQIKDLISSVGITTEIVSKEAEVFWGKLVRLNAIACTTSASGQPIGFIRADKWWREQLEGCVLEASSVALAEGVKIDPQAVMAKIASLPAGLTTSMQRDIQAGKPSELDAIAGAVVRAGSRHSLDCPVIKGLIERIQSQINV